jgi:hypothetical protein
MNISIWAPHCDDELIGCSQLLMKGKTNLITVFYPTGTPIQESEKMSRELGIETGAWEFHTEWGRWDIVFAPDPSVESHPLHRELGNQAEYLFRQGKIKRLFLYTTTMNAPYIFEVSDPIAKRDLMNRCYPKKDSLWKWDHKFWLFEGWIEWHRPGVV